MTKFTEGQWPDRICSGFIRYHPSNNILGGYILSDASHGIPVFAAIGASAEVFNYPKQTEDIARRLVACWNALTGKSIEEIEELANANIQTTHRTSV